MTQREFKFRAWNGKKMIDLERITPLILNTEAEGVFVPFDEHLAVMQFTGLKDKGGSEIWEGDIFQIANNHMYEVSYASGMEEHSHELHGACFLLRGIPPATFPFDEWAMENGQIIGNIHENPDLLVAGHLIPGVG